VKERARFSKSAPRNFAEGSAGWRNQNLIDMNNNFHGEEIRAASGAAGLRFALVVSRFNSFITYRLLAGAMDALEAAGAPEENITVVHVPGAFEIPLTAKKLAEAGRTDAVIAIGCILRGETAHFDYVASEVARGVQLAQLDTGIPVIFCVLTCDTLEQAIDRAGLKSGNKGYDAGVAAIEMGNLAKQLRPAAAAASRAGKTAPRGKRR
jgi:6,7-dimethyl-8-ribityllumazine synthase